MPYIYCDPDSEDTLLLRRKINNMMHYSHEYWFITGKNLYLLLASEILLILAGSFGQ